MLSKWSIFFLTFFAYAAIHSMRMGYAQIKPQFQSAFQLTHLQLGIFDAAIYLSLGIGYFLRYKFETKKKLNKIFFVSMTVACIAFVYIPISSLLLGQKVRDSFILKQLLPAICLLIFGFAQFPSWPTLLTIINSYFDVQKQGDITGAWSACGDIGNILGLLLSGIMITNLHLKWQYLMLTVATLNWLATLLIYLNIKQHQGQARLSGQIELQYNQGATSQFDEFLTFAKQITYKQQNKLFLLSMGLLKAILYAFLLWMPTYLTSNNMAYYKSTVPIFFNIGGLIGSFFLGYLYNDLQSRQKDLFSKLFNHFKIYSLFYSCSAVTVIFAIIYIWKISIILFILLSMISGIFLAGCFNMLTSNQVIAIAKGNRQNVSKLSTLSMAIGNLLVGIVEFIVGVVLDVKSSNSGQNTLFIILVSIGLITMLTLLRRSYLLSQSQNEPQQSQKQ